MYKGKEYYIDKTKKYMWEHQLTQKEMARQLEISPSSLSLFLSGNSCSQEQRGYFYCRRLINKIDNEQEMKTNLTRCGLYLKNHDINKIKFIYRLLKNKYNINHKKYEFHIDEYSVYGGNDIDIIEYFKRYNIDLKIYGYKFFKDSQSFDIDISNATEDDMTRLENDINKI